MQHYPGNGNEFYFFHGGGKMGSLMRSKDWQGTSLGNPAQWPVNLQVTLSVVLNSCIAMLIAWGPEHIPLFNDAFSGILGPAGMVYMGTSMNDANEHSQRFLAMLEDGYCKVPGCVSNNAQADEMRHYDFFYSPLQNPDGTTAGFLVIAVP